MLINFKLRLINGCGISIFNGRPYEYEASEQVYNCGEYIKFNKMKLHFKSTWDINSQVVYYGYCSSHRFIIYCEVLTIEILKYNK